MSDAIVETAVEDLLSTIEMQNRMLGEYEDLVKLQKHRIERLERQVETLLDVASRAADMAEKHLTQGGDAA